MPLSGRLLSAIWAIFFSLAGIPAWAGDHGQANTSALRDASEESNLLQEWSGDYKPLIPDRTPSAKVQLKEGDNPERRAPGSAEEMAVKPAGKRAFGFLNGRPAAAVVLITDPGGSGTFYALALLFKNADTWVNVDTLFLGDRVRLQGVGIQENEIVVNMIVHGPGEPMCCPTLQVIKRFTVRENRLVATGEEIIGEMKPRD